MMYIFSQYVKINDAVEYLDETDLPVSAVKSV